VKRAGLDLVPCCYWKLHSPLNTTFHIQVSSHIHTQTHTHTHTMHTHVHTWQHARSIQATLAISCLAPPTARCLRPSTCAAQLNKAAADAAEFKAGFDKAVYDNAEMKSGYDKFAADAAEYKAGFDKAVYDNAEQKAQVRGVDGAVEGRRLQILLLAFWGPCFCSRCRQRYSRTLPRCWFFGMSLLLPFLGSCPGTLLGTRR
jgi:hypothetical protein